MTQADTKTKARKVPMTVAERKRRQAIRDRAAGFRQVNVKVPASRAEDLKAFARKLMEEGVPV